MPVTLVSAAIVAPRVARRPAGARAARRVSASQVRHRVSASAGDDAVAPAAVSRREAVSLPVTSALAALVASAVSAAPARARGLPELACDGELVTAPAGVQFCDAVVG